MIIRIFSVSVRVQKVLITAIPNEPTKTGFGNGNAYGITMGSVDYQDDAIVAMQTPGEVFAGLPVDIQERIIELPYAERSEGFLEKPCLAAQTFGTVRKVTY